MPFSRVRSGISRTAALALAAALCPLTPAALAADDTQASAGLQEASPSVWTAKIDAQLWFVAPAGNVRLARDGGDTLNLDNDLASLELDGTRLAPSGEVELGYDKFLLRVAGFRYSATDEATPGYAGNLGDPTFAADDRLDVSMDFGTYELQGGYELLAGNISPRAEADGGGFRVRHRLFGLAGIRIYETNFEFTSQTDQTLRDEDSEVFFEPHVGALWRVDIFEQFGLDALATVGYWPTDREAFGGNLEVGFWWRPVTNVGVQLGYRILAFNLTEDDGDDNSFEYVGQMAGLTAGITLRF